MENESTSTWAFLNKSGEIESIESDPGSSSESSIEFIHDEIVHYERNNNQCSSLQPEVQKDSQDVSENSFEVWSFHDTIFDGATVADHGSAMKDENGERSRRDLTLENITSANSNASVSPNSKSPVSPSSSDDSSGSVTLLEGRFSDGDLDTFPEDFWFDSDFELLDQHSSSDLAHLQLASGANNALPANQRPKINFKYKKQALGKSLTESANANDADDESSNNVEQCSSAEESEVALTASDDIIPPVTNLGSLAPAPSHLLVPSLLLKPPRMSITFMMLASLVVGLLLGFTTKYSLSPYSSEQLSEDIAEMQRINEMHLLIEENEHMRKYVDSLKWRMNNLQNSKKQQLSNELRQVNQLLKNRLDELDQQLLAVRNEIFEKKSGVQPPVVSNSRNQDLSADVPQDLNEPASDSGLESQTEISSSVGAAFHDDIIQIQSSPEENVDVSFNEGSTDQISSLGVSLVLHQNDPSVSSDKIIKSENKAHDAIAVLQKKLEEEKMRADNLEKLYAEMKQLVDSLKPATDSTALLAGASTVETVQGEKAKKVKESTSYCSLLDKDCSARMDWLNRDAMLLLITSVISEIPPQAQQWKEYMVKKFQSMIDSQDQEESDEEVKVNSETTSDFQFNKLNVYMNRMLNQMTRAKEDLQNKFEKTLHKIKKGTSKFWEKTISRSEKEIKSRKLKEKKESRELVDNEAKATSSQDSSLQVTKEKYMDSIDVEKEYNKINRKKEEFGQLQKGLEVVEIEENKHKFDKKSKSIRSNEDKRHQHHESADSKKHHSHKFDHKKKKQQPLHSNNEDKHGHNMKHWPQKSNYKEKKYQLHMLDNEEKYHRHRSYDKEHQSDKKEKKHRHRSNDDREHRSDKEEKKHRHRSNDDREHRSDKEEKKHRHRSNDDREHWSDKEEKKHRHRSNDDREHRSDKEEKKHRHRSNDDREHRSDKEEKKHRHRSNDDREHWSDKEEKKHRHRSNDDREHWSDKEEKKHRHRSNDDRKHWSDKEEKKLHGNDDDIKHWSRKSDDGDKKYRLHKPDVNNNKYQEHDYDDTEKQNQTYKSAKTKKHWPHISGDKKKLFRNHKFQNNGKRIIDKNLFNAKAASHERKNKVKEDSDKKSMKEQKNFQKKFNRRSKHKLEMEAQSKDNCDQLAVRLQDSISTITKKKFRHMNLHTILRMSKKLSSFNKQCKHFSSNSVKVWSACQQMWWTLCGQGYLPGQLQNFKCQHYLLAWQMSAAASPDGGGKSGCDDCGCQNKAVNQKDLNKDDSDSAFGNVEEEKEEMSGEWYFKHKSVPAENKEKDCDENEFECIAADLLNEMESDSLPYLNQMLNAESHRMNHYSHVHRRRCRDYSNYNVNCWFHPAHKGKWFSVIYQNFMNFIQNWQK